MWRKYYYFILLFLLASIFTASAYLRHVFSDMPSIYKLDEFQPSLNSKIYDSQGELITELFTERRTLVPLSKIPIELQNAVIAIEDESFFSHWGVSTKGILRAFITNLLSGKIIQGGSTITQQLTKVLFLTQERTLSRKIKEFVLSLQLEHNFSKHEILQMYLNQIYFGKGAYGTHSAAKIYFGKKTEELNLPECAMLAGLPKAPNYYSPLVNPLKAITRRRIVLKRMQQLKFITEEEEEEANKFPLVTDMFPQIPKYGSYFVELVRQQMEQKYGVNTLYQGGLAIHTTLDLEMQKAAEEEFEAYLLNFDTEKAAALSKKIKQLKFKNQHMSSFPFVQISSYTLKAQSSLIAIDPKTGAIKAMIGGRDFVYSQFNRAVQAKRQPGSTFKPFVWAKALESGMAPNTIINDLPLAYYNDDRDWRVLEDCTDYYMIAACSETITMARGLFESDKVWLPNNWDNKFFGPVTLRKALEQSRNIASVRLIDEVGPPNVVDLAKRMGFKSKLDAVLSLGLGTSVVTLQELTSAFGTFANNGIYVEPYSVSKVLDQRGNVLEEHFSKETAALDQKTNYLVINMLKGVIERGTGVRAKALNKTAAGKTGTSQDFRDLWFVGFTPDLAAGVWMGYDDFHPLGDELSSSGTIVPLWTRFMKRALAKTPDKDFFVPKDIVFVKIDSETGKLALNSCPNVILESFIRDSEPTEFCDKDHLQELPEPITEENTEH